MARAREMLHARKAFKSTTIDPLPLHKAINLLPIDQATSHVECTLLALAESHSIYCNDCPHLLVFHILVKMPIGYPPLVLSLCSNKLVISFHLFDNVREGHVFRDVEVLDNIVVIFPVAGQGWVMAVYQRQIWVVFRGQLFHPTGGTTSFQSLEVYRHTLRSFVWFDESSPATVWQAWGLIAMLPGGWTGGVELSAFILRTTEPQGEGNDNGMVSHVFSSGCRTFES